MLFAIPHNCPEKITFTYPQLVEQTDCNDRTLESNKANLQSLPPSSPRKISSLATNTPEVETLVRRSRRIRDRNVCFKHMSCADKNCLACEATPPTIPNNFIKDIEEKVCKIPSDKLSDIALSAKSSSKKAIGDMKTPKKDVGQKTDAEKNRKKKALDEDNEAKKKNKN
ncbi:hypothetical protein PVAP13_3NG201626 [Panicum virgatum]|uniref:Uncharacterized protein n=1 Tax=Panicum virgatum TaxID=38727 RepID=A0A8T0UI23_PANVG|nr:hypothetical protein PVAP13_3NG201626 [Panicum virgatum]